jgi:hypothetical protein
MENTENKLEDNQMGFCPNRSPLDNIFIVRQIFEKSYEHNVDLYNTFVDYTHAFDSVYRNKVIDRLMKFKVPDKLIRYSLNLNTHKINRCYRRIYSKMRSQKRRSLISNLV